MTEERNEHIDDAELDDQLQRYFDGELPDEEADALRSQIDGDEVLQQKLDGLSQLRTLLREALSPEHLEAPDADALFAAIEGAVEQADDEAEEGAVDAASEEAPRLRVLDGGKAPEPEAPPAEEPSRAWWGVAAIGLAAAAAVLFFVLRPGESSTGTETPDPVATATPPPGSEIEQVDFGHSTGAIFQIEDEGAEYAVVWISDEKPPELAVPTNPDENQDRIQ